MEIQPFEVPTLRPVYPLTVIVFSAGEIYCTVACMLARCVVGGVKQSVDLLANL